MATGWWSPSGRRRIERNWAQIENELRANCIQISSKCAQIGDNALRECWVYFENRRAQEDPVSIQDLIREYIRYEVAIGIPLVAGDAVRHERVVRNRINRWRKAMRIVYRKGTHCAQNSIYDMTVLAD